MAPPFKIIVLADLAPGREAGPPLKVEPRGAEKLLGDLSPVFRLGDPAVELKFTGFEDFTPPAVAKGRDFLLADTSQMTKVIHHPGFMALESAWRGLKLVADALPEEGVDLYVLCTPADGMRQRFYDHVFLPEYRGETAAPAGLVLADFDLTHKPGSLGALADMAKMAQSIQAPAVFQTTSQFFGVGNLLHLAALSALDKRLMGPEYTSYTAFREKEEATWVSLCVNRYLQRPPFEGLAYTEPASADKPEAYLWGRAVWVVGANAARSFGKTGSPAGISGLGSGGEQRGLATRELPISRKEKVVTPLEVVLPQDLVEMLPYFGLTPLTQLPAELGGSQQPDTAYIHLAANLRRFTDPSGQKPSLLLVYATLAYSLILGRAGNLGLALLPETAGMGPLEAAAMMQQRLTEDLGHLAQGELTVEAVDGGLHVHLKPEYVIHGKNFEVEFDLPLGG